MATPEVRPLTRNELKEFLRNPDGTPNWRAIIAFENTQAGADVATVTANASFLTVIDEEPTLPNSRRVQATAPIVVTDTGPGGVLDFDLADTPVVPGEYGSASQTVSFVVTRRGRIQSAAEYDLNTSNITEGSNLFYTNARVWAALSADAGELTFNSGTGAFGLATTTVTPGTYGDATNVAQVTVDAFGRATAAANVPISFPGTSGFTGTGAYTNFEIVDGLIVNAS